MIAFAGWMIALQLCRLNLKPLQAAANNECIHMQSLCRLNASFCKLNESLCRLNDSLCKLNASLCRLEQSRCRLDYGSMD